MTTYRKIPEDPIQEKSNHDVVKYSNFPGIITTTAKKKGGLSEPALKIYVEEKTHTTSWFSPI